MSNPELEILLLAGLDSGEDIELTTEFWRQLKDEAHDTLPLVRPK